MSRKSDNITAQSPLTRGLAPEASTHSNSHLSSPLSTAGSSFRRNVSTAEVDMRILEKRLAAPDATPSANNSKPIGTIPAGPHAVRTQDEIDRTSNGDRLDRCFVAFCGLIATLLGVASRVCSFMWRGLWGFANPLKPAALRQAENDLENAETYDAWREAAEAVDRMNGVEAWRHQPEHGAYDHGSLASRLRKLRQVRAAVSNATSASARAKAVERMAHTLRAGLARNLAGMGNPALYEQSNCGTKALIEDYVDEVVNQLLFLAKTDTAPVLSPMQKLLFFRETRHAFGRTALMLSGGGSLAFFHIGVIRALLDGGVMPRVMSGSSGGAVVAAVAGCRTDEELSQLLQVDEHGRVPGIVLDPFESLSTGSVKRKLARFCAKGVLYDIRVLGRFLRANVGDLTFLEAYRRTHRILNITVTSPGTTSNSGDGTGQILNYLTAPNVIVWTAVLASCSIPGIFEPVELWAKASSGQVRPYHFTRTAWIDGSLGGDLPTQRLSELFNVNHTIVSQINPWAAPFIPRSDVPVGDMPWSLGGIARRVTFALGSWVQFSAQLGTRLGVLPSVVARALRLVWQSYTGDITIVPSQLTPWELSFVLRNPTGSFMALALARGQKRTWPKMSLILSRCAVEQALEQCVRLLQEKIAAGGGGGKLPPLQLPQPPLESATAALRSQSHQGDLRLPRATAVSAGWASPGTVPLSARNSTGGQPAPQRSTSDLSTGSAPARASWRSSVPPLSLDSFTTSGLDGRGSGGGGFTPLLNGQGPLTAPAVPTFIRLPGSRLMPSAAGQGFTSGTGGTGAGGHAADDSPSDMDDQAAVTVPPLEWETAEGAGSVQGVIRRGASRISLGGGGEGDHPPLELERLGGGPAAPSSLNRTAVSADFDDPAAGVAALAETGAEAESEGRLFRVPSFMTADGGGTPADGRRQN